MCLHVLLHVCCKQREGKKEQNESKNACGNAQVPHLSPLLRVHIPNFLVNETQIKMRSRAENHAFLFCF